MVITDEMLYQSAEHAREIWLATFLCKDEIPEYVCSENFEQQVSVLLQQQSNKPVAKRFLRNNSTEGRRHPRLRQVAAVLLAVLLIGSVIIFSSPTARATVFNWIHEVFVDHEIYHLDGGNNPSFTIPSYQPSWLPEGFVVMDNYHDAGTCGAFYLNEKTGDSISFECIFTENTSASIIVQDYDTKEPVVIGGIEGYYYSEGKSSKDKTIVWADETANIVFSVRSSLDKDTLLRIARSISMDKNN